MRFGGIVLVALLTLGACSSDPQPREPRRTATSATPTATPPTMPPQAEKDTPEGAAAFVRHYIDVFNYAAKTGSTEPLKSLSQGCAACDKYALEFESIYQRGDHVSTHLWTLKSLDLEVEAREVRVFAGTDVNEGRIRRYTFVFRLPSKPPFSIRAITIAEAP
jgi:hypothetical protein